MLRKVLKTKLNRKLGKSQIPYKINLFLTYSCNLKCKTCLIWKKYRKRSELRKRELTADHWKTFFKKMGDDLYWLSISGGEPFLREDLAEIATSIENKNLILFSMNTNGYLTEKIYSDVKTILESLNKKTKFFLAVSLCGFEKTHNIVTGTNSYKRAERTHKLLKTLENDYKNFRLDRELLISKYNLNEVKKITDYLNRMKTPFVITLAQESGYYENIGNGLGFSGEEKRKLANILKDVKIPIYRKEDLVKRAFKNLVIKSLENQGQVIPCYSTWSSIRIDPYGNIYPCIMRSEVLGNLRNNQMGMRKALGNPKIKNVQKDIKAGACSCWTPCEAYQSIIQNFPFI